MRFAALINPQNYLSKSINALESDTSIASPDWTACQVLILDTKKQIQIWESKIWIKFEIGFLNV